MTSSWSRHSIVEIKFIDFLHEKRGFIHARLSHLCGAKTPCFSSSLRFSARTRWRLEKLGSAERPIAEPKRETAGDDGGRSSPGVSNLRRGDCRGRVWSRRSHRLGSGN